jgi:hypothetical protein
MMQAAVSYPISHQQRLQATITTMRQLYEEVAGYGFYSPKREDDYAALAPAQPVEEK